MVLPLGCRRVVALSYSGRGQEPVTDRLLCGPARGHHHSSSSLFTPLTVLWDCEDVDDIVGRWIMVTFTTGHDEEAKNAMYMDQKSI